MRSLVLVCGCALGLAATARAAPRPPSEVLHDIVAGRMAAQTLSPEEVERRFAPLLAGARKTGLGPDEEVALGMAYFFTFDGLSAKPLLEKHAGRADRLGRVATQALAQMAYFGEHDLGRVERMLADYRRRFRPVAEDLEHTAVMVANLARERAKAGDHAGAARMVLDDVAGLPLDLPMRGFDNLGRLHESFVAAGRAKEAIAWLERHRDALRARLGDGGAATAPEATLGLAHRRGVLHLHPFDEWLLEDEPGADRASVTRAIAARAVERLESWIAAARAGRPIPPR